MPTGGRPGATTCAQLQPHKPDPLNAFIENLANHKRYHANLVTDLDKLLSTPSSSTHSQTSSQWNQGPDIVNSANAPLSQQVKRLVNQTLITLSSWSKVLHAPDSTDMVPRETCSSQQHGSSNYTTSHVAAVATTDATEKLNRASKQSTKKGRSGSVSLKLAPVNTTRATTTTGTITAKSNVSTKRVGAMRGANKAAPAATTTISSYSPRNESKTSRSVCSIISSTSNVSTTMAIPSAAGLSMPTIADDSIYDTDHPTYAHIALLVDIGFLGMKTLESMSDDTVAPNHLLELEKARSNMVTKIIHLGMKKRALLELGVMRERLIKAAMKLWDEQGLEARDRHHNQKQQIGEAIASSSSAESLKRQYQHLFMFPLPAAISRSLASSGKSSPLSLTNSSVDCIPTFMLLVLALFNNAVRCWTDVRNGALAYLLHEMTTQQDSAYEWCKNLVMIQGPSVARQFDIMFRLLFIAAGKAVERNPLREGQRHAFLLRMLGVKYFVAFQVYGTGKDKDKDEDKDKDHNRNNSTNIWEKIMRIGVEHDRSTKDGQSNEDIYTIATAYKNAFEFARDMSMVDHSDPCYQKWHSHYEYLVNKADDLSLRSFVQSIRHGRQDQKLLEMQTPSSTSLLQHPSLFSRNHTSPVIIGDKILISEPTSTLRSVTAPTMQLNMDPIDQVFSRLDQAVNALREFEGFLRNWSTGTETPQECDLDISLEKTKSVLKSLEQSLSAFPGEGLTGPTLNNIARIFKSMDTLRNLGSRTLDKHENEQKKISESSIVRPSTDRQMRLLGPIHDVIAILSDVAARLWRQAKTEYLTWFNSNPKLNPNPTKLSCARVDAILYMFRLHQSGLLSPTADLYKPILDLLESAYTMALDMHDKESLPWISNALFTYGGTLFKAGRKIEAIRPLQAAIECYTSWFGDDLLIDHSLDQSAMLVDTGTKDKPLKGKGSLTEARMLLANRYEVLGACLQALNELDRGLESFNAGLCVLPLDAFQQIDTLSSVDLKSNRLIAANLLTRRIRILLMMKDDRLASIVTSVPEFEAKVSQPIVPSHFRGIIQEFECGLISVLSVRPSQLDHCHRAQIDILQHLRMRVYKGGRALLHPVRRAKVLVQLAILYQNSMDEGLRHEALHLVEEAIEILKEGDLENDQDLEPIRNHRLAMAYTWYGILDRHREDRGLVKRSKHFQIALQLWEVILSQVECFVSWEDAQLMDHQARVESVRRQLQEPEILFDHLQMLADCLGMVDYRVMQVQIYMLMLRLCNGVLPMTGDTCADAVRIYSRMAQAYLALGYSGKAKMALNHGKLILEDMPRTSTESAALHNEVYATWLLAHSLYLTSVGHNAQSIETYNQAKHQSDLRQRNHPISSLLSRNTAHAIAHGGGEIGGTMAKPLGSKLHWAMILVEASLARSQLLFNEGNLTEAISDAMRAYRQLCRIVGSLSVALEAAKRERKEAAVRQQPMENPFLVQEVDQASKNGQKQERSSAETQQLRQGLELLVTQRYQWSIFRLIIETFHHLAKLYLIQGSAREAEYFVMEGKHMALVSKAGKSMDQFLFDQAQLGLRKHQWKESKEILEELAMQEDESGPGAFTWEIQDARIQLLYGDYYFAIERLDHSLDAYFRTDQVLSHLMDKSVISGLEQLVIREPQTPREKKLVTLYHHQRSHGLPKHMLRLRSGSHSSVELHGQGPVRTSTSDQAQFECATLNEIKVAMGYRASLVYFMKGHRTQALDLIEKSKAEDPMVFTISEYHLAKAKMLMLELEDTMAKHLMYAMIPDSALSVGLFKKTRTLQLNPPPALYTLQSANSNGDDDNSMEDVYALSSLIMNPPIGVGSAISSSPSVRVKKMTRRRRSQLAYEEALSNVAPQSTSSKKNSLNRYVEILMDARKHLSEAYRYSILACPPHVVSDICGRQAYLAVLESCFHQETEALISEDGSGYSGQWAMACRAACFLEKAKAVSQWREMQGLIKQKLNPILPLEDQAWPREIRLKNSTGLNQGPTWPILPSQGRIPPQTQRTGRKTISYIGLEKPRRLQFSTSIDDRLDAGHPGSTDIVDSVAGEDEEVEDIDLAEVGMKPEELRTRHGKREYLNRRLLIHPSSSMGNERSFLEILDKAYEQDIQIMDGEFDDDLGQSFQRDFIDIIPEKWVVVSLSMDVEHEVLYVNRLRAKAMPIVVRLPLNRDQLREGDDQELGLRLGLGLRGMSEFDDEEQSPRGNPLSYKDAVEELQGILKGSQETLNVTSTGATLSSSTEFGRPQSVELTREVKAEWWSQRQRLDDRLCALLGAMEDQWLCGLKGLIQSHNTPADMDNLLRFKRALEWIMSQAANSMPSSAPASGVRAGTSSRQGPLTQLEISVELCRAILNLGDQPTFAELKDLIYFLLDAYLYKSVSVSPSSSAGVSVAESPFQSPPHSTSFTSSFIDYSEVQFGRIAMQIKEALRCYWLAETQAKNNGYDDGAHVILILDKHLQSFPWESCPVLRGEAVSRMPSMWFLRDRILQQRYRIAQGQGQEREQEQAQDESQTWRDLEVDPQRTYYILNPAGDLKNTETEFREYVEAQEGWNGVLGRAPMPLEVMNGLSQNELYVYFGHSGGEQYIKSSQIRQLGNCAVSLLLGCSSGSLKGAGEFDPTGNAVNYLLAGCPTLVANLWDVTDRDLDRFSKAMFSLWGLDQNCRDAGTRQHQEQQMRSETEDMEDVQQQDPTAEDDYDEEKKEEEEARRDEQGLRLSIVEAVKEARDECRLKYLVGAASVVYGIPCYVKA